MIKYKITSFFIIFLLLFIASCKENGKKEYFAKNSVILNKSKKYIHDGYKKFKANDSSDFEVEFNAFHGSISISLSLSNRLSFPEQIEEFKIILLKANRFFNYDSIHFIGMDIFLNSGDLILDISNVIEIQNYLKYCEESKIPIDYRIVSKYVLKSEYIQLLLNCLKTYSLKPKWAFIEKCHLCKMEILENTHKKKHLKSIKIMICNSLSIRLVKEIS